MHVIQVQFCCLDFDANRFGAPRNEWSDLYRNVRHLWRCGLYRAADSYRQQGRSALAEALIMACD